MEPDQAVPKKLRTRFAPEVSGPDVEELREDLGLVRGGLQAGVDRRARWLARLAPPSTLRWASAGLGSWTADLLDRFDTVVCMAGS